MDSNNNNDDADWGEWDGQSPFWIHCVTGSLAGVTEVTVCGVVQIHSFSDHRLKK